MKSIKYKLIITGCLGLLVLIFACGKSFLTKPALGTLSQQDLATKAGVEGLLIGAYSQLTGSGSNASDNLSWGSSGDNWVYGSVVADDSYKGSEASDQGDIQSLEIWTATSTDSYPMAKWSLVYDAIQRCNMTIQTMRIATGLLPSDTIQITAEARFLRGYYHFEAKKMWNMVPYIGDNITVTSPYVPNNTDIWPQIIADFQYAMANLPNTQPNVGRPNHYAAEAYLAKVYMFQHDYTDAMTALNDLISNGVTSNGLKYGLNTSFQSNFNALQKNEQESVFACQMAVNDGSAAAANISGAAHDYGDALNFPYNGGPGACCGFNNPSEDLANAYKTVNGLPLLDGSFQNAPFVSDPSNTPWTGTLDPRIDWTMGRQGIAYLDWGNHPGDAWIRNPPSDGHFSPKKNVYAQSEKGTTSDATGTFWAAVELDADNYNLIRFADVLLWAAECQAQIGSLDVAEGYVNQVRNRVATTPLTWVYNDANFDASTYMYDTQTDTSLNHNHPPVLAANYAISPYAAGAFTAMGQTAALNAIWFERRLELAMEGNRFFDLQRYDNGTGLMAQVLTRFAQVTAAYLPAGYWGGATFTKGKNEYFAIPLDQIDVETISGKSALTQNPGYN
jgi:starch-binding outer membrane protein, SusD/RagB family